MHQNRKELLGRLAAARRAEAAAAAPPSAGGQQAAGATVTDDLCVIVANDRDRRTLAWLRGQVGDAAILAAAGQMLGNRKPYLSNVAKSLGVSLPGHLADIDRETALQHLAAARAKLNP
jgi:hypothetical protein